MFLGSIKVDAVRVYWSLESALHIPATRKPIVDLASRLAIDATPLRNSSSYPINLHKLRLIRVCHLLFLCSPTTIIGRVILVAINPIQTVLRAGLFTHILQKISKIIPALTELNPAPAIPSVRPIVRVVAPLLHRTPRVKFGPMINVTPVAVVRVFLTGLIYIHAQYCNVFISRSQYD